MKIFFTLSLFLLIAILNKSCSNSQIIHICSEDRNNCVTIITDNNIRYVIAGKTKRVPEINYLKLDISQVDNLADGIWICWLPDNNWDMVVQNSVIVENQLDTTKYFFSNQLPKDENGIPHETKFRENNCAIFDFYTMRLSPDKGAIVEIK
ncbi:MAG: hypothetical protein K0B09_06815 [Bacteroidales bacterium]|nr:hypothetical protein [Bacteroidales bacterium]